MVTMGRQIMVAAGVTLALSVAAAEDPLDRRLISLGHGGVDCGRIGERGVPRAEVVACVTQHLKTNRPFRARLDTAMIDSFGGIGLVLEDIGDKHGGAFFVVEFDSMGCGAERASDPYCRTVIRQCQLPRLIPADGRLTVSCNNKYRF